MYPDKSKCKVTNKECKDLWLIKDQYGIQYGTCHKANCLIWNVKKCNGSNPQREEILK